MARCGCGGNCNCTIQEGTRVSVSGNGTPENPYIISVDAEGDTVTTSELADALALYAPLQRGIFDFTATAGSTQTMPDPVVSRLTYWRGLIQGNCTIDALPVVTTPGGIYVTLKIKMDATGGWTVTLPTIDWVHGSAPTITNTANATTYVTLWTEGSSDVWHGVAV